MENIKRGQIYYADLTPTVGSEQGGCRPVLIIQNDKGNKYAPTVIIAPITSQISTKHTIPTHKKITCDDLPKKSMVLLEQVRCIDKKRLREYVGTVTPHTMEQVRLGLQISLGL